MANDQNNMNAGADHQNRNGIDPSATDTSMGTHAGMGKADSGMTNEGWQRGMENHEVSTQTTNDRNPNESSDQRDGNGRTIFNDGEAQSENNTRQTGGDSGGMSNARSNESDR